VPWELAASRGCDTAPRRAGDRGVRGIERPAPLSSSSRCCSPYRDPRRSGDDVVLTLGHRRAKGPGAGPRWLASRRLRTRQVAATPADRREPHPCGVRVLSGHGASVCTTVDAKGLLVRRQRRAGGGESRGTCAGVRFRDLVVRSRDAGAFTGSTPAGRPAGDRSDTSEAAAFWNDASPTNRLHLAPAPSTGARCRSSCPTVGIRPVLDRPQRRRFRSRSGRATSFPGTSTVGQTAPGRRSRCPAEHFTDIPIHQNT
jgi:hypothetical protein